MVEEKDREQRELRAKLERVTRDDESAQAELLRLTEKMGEIKHVLVLRERELAELKNSMKAKK